MYILAYLLIPVRKRGLGVSAHSVASNPWSVFLFPMPAFGKMIYCQCCGYVCHVSRKEKGGVGVWEWGETRPWPQAVTRRREAAQVPRNTQGLDVPQRPRDEDIERFDGAVMRPPGCCQSLGPWRCPPPGPSWGFASFGRLEVLVLLIFQSRRLYQCKASEAARHKFAPAASELRL
jgi:hypothetical protein